MPCFYFSWNVSVNFTPFASQEKSKGCVVNPVYGRCYCFYSCWRFGSAGFGSLTLFWRCFPWGKLTHLHQRWPQNISDIQYSPLFVLTTKINAKIINLSVSNNWLTVKFTPAIVINGFFVLWSLFSDSSHHLSLSLCCWLCRDNIYGR